MKKSPGPDGLLVNSQTCKGEKNTSLTQFFFFQKREEGMPPKLFHEANKIIYEKLRKTIQHNQ